MTSRLRAALVLGMVAAAEVVAAPAFASTTPAGGDGSGGLSVVQTLLLYVGAPVLAFVIITLLVVGPSLSRANTEDRTGVHHPVLGGAPRPALAPPEPQQTRPPHA